MRERIGADQITHNTGNCKDPRTINCVRNAETQRAGTKRFAIISGNSGNGSDSCKISIKSATADHNSTTTLSSKRRGTRVAAAREEKPSRKTHASSGPRDRKRSVFRASRTGQRRKMQVATRPTPAYNRTPARCCDAGRFCSRFDGRLVFWSPLLLERDDFLRNVIPAISFV